MTESSSKPFFGSSSVGRGARLNPFALAAIAVLALMALPSCMLEPHDQEEVGKTSDVLFMGGSPIPNAKISIQALEPQAKTWDEIGSTTSTSLTFSFQGADFFVWSKRQKIPNKYWTKACASTGEYARVRTGWTLGYLMSLEEDWWSCYLQNNGNVLAFIQKCGAPEDPIAQVNTQGYRDFGKECVEKINTLRALEGLPALARHKAEECSADDDAKLNHLNGAHYSQSGDAQNECGAWSSIDDVLDKCIDQQMYKDEKKCYQQSPDTCYHDTACMCGHYVNMTDTLYKKVACGLYKTSSGEFKSVQNFYK